MQFSLIFYEKSIKYKELRSFSLNNCKTFFGLFSFLILLASLGMLKPRIFLAMDSFFGVCVSYLAEN
jgi:hypothetical protein